MRSLRPYVLLSDELEAVLLPDAGGRLNRLRAFGHELLRTPDDPATHADEPFFWGAYVMAPWCNRAPAGRSVVDGSTIDLRPNFPDGSAIHGLLVTRAWMVRDDGALHAVGGGADGWPWRFEVEMRPSVVGPTLRLALLLRNLSDTPMPAGIGIHPWFVAPVEVALPAAAAYRSNTDSAPRPEPALGDLDLRTLRAPAVGLDGTWTELATPAIELAWSEAGIGARLAVDAPRVLVALASPAGLGAVAIEPQTHGPDGLRRLLRGEPDALHRLPPGGTLELDLRLDVRRL